METSKKIFKSLTLTEKDYVMENLDTTIQEALTYAKQKGLEADKELPPESQRGLDCGFAWVECRPANSKLGKALKKIGAKKHWQSGLTLWNPAGLMTQSIGPKEIGAYAFVSYLKERVPQECYKQLFANSRLD